MKIHTKEEFPTRVADEDFSVDVFTCDEDGLLNIGYYNFDTKRWAFHTDTMVDYYEEGIPEMNFNWMYPPPSLTKIAHSESDRTHWRLRKHIDEDEA